MPPSPIEEPPGLFGRLAAFLLDHRPMAALALAVLVGGVAAGGLFTTVDFSARTFFGADDPALGVLDEHTSRWGNDDLVMVVVDGQGSTVLTPERLAVLADAVDALDALEVVTHVASLSTKIELQKRFMGLISQKTLLETLPDDPAELGDWQQARLDDIALVPTFLAADGQRAAIVVVVDANTDDLAAASSVMFELEQVVAPFQGAQGLEFSFAGIPSLRSAIIRAISSDQLLFAPFTGGLVIVLLVLLFRSRHGVLVPAVAALTPLVMLIGAMGYLGAPVGLLNQTFFMLIPAIAIADAVHLVSRYHEESRRVTEPGAPHTRDTQRRAIVAAMKHMGLACFLTSFTTAVGFASLLGTRMPVLRAYGLYAALGIGFAYFTVLLIVPLALSLTRKAAPLSRTDASGAMGSLLQGCARTAQHRPWLVLSGTALLVALSAWAGSYVLVDIHMSQTLAPSDPVRQANDAVERSLGGLVGIEFDLDGGHEGAMRDLELLTALRRVELAVGRHEHVEVVVSPAFLLATTWGMLSDGPAMPPANRADAMMAIVGPQAVRSKLVDETWRRGRIVVRTRDIGAVAFADLAPDLEAIVARELEGTGLQVRTTGTTYVTYRGMLQVTSDLRNSLMGAFLVIAFVIAVLFRSASLGLISVLPNALPLVLAYGMLGLIGGELDMQPAIVFTIALGLGVDATIHVLARFNEERNDGKSVAEATTEAVTHSGRAIAITSVILAAAFAINLFSSFPGLVLFGAMGAIIVLGSLLANLLVLPAILTVVYRGR